MEVKLIVDQRERELKELLDNYEAENLDVGDIQYRRGDELLLVIERKSVKDLAASIQDGRHREQKARLLGCGIPRDRIMFVVEGKLGHDPAAKISNIPAGTLLSSIINTEFRDGVRVHKTQTVGETAFFVEKMREKLEKEGEKFWSYEEGKEVSAADYCGTLKTKKKENMTVDVWYLSVLSLIPQVTVQAAEAIASEYGTLEILTDSFYEEGAEMLKDLTYTTGGGNSRRVGPKMSSRIYEYVCRCRSDVLDGTT